MKGRRESARRRNKVVARSKKINIKNFRRTGGQTGL